MKKSEASQRSNCRNPVWSDPDLVNVLAPRRGERILDVGCGMGAAACRIAESGAVVTGIDKSAIILKQARLLSPKVEFVACDLLQYFPTHPFDAIFSQGTLQWIHPLGVAAKRLFDLLRPGGRIVVELGGHEAAFGALEVAREILGNEVPLVPKVWYFPSLMEYSTVLESVGFQVICFCLFHGLGVSGNEPSDDCGEGSPPAPERTTAGVSPPLQHTRRWFRFLARRPEGVDQG